MTTNPQVPTADQDVVHDAPLAPETGPQSVTLEAFCLNRFGPKHQDQARGFAFWARKNGHRRASVAEWTALLQEFGNRPVGAQS